MISCPNIEKRTIRGHYNLSTPFYRLLWGPHIHHGLWEADEAPTVAQLQLTDRLASLAKLSTEQKMLDVGCGMGASSIHLAKTLNCSAVGITVSRLQRHWAATSARWHGVSDRTEFHCADAEQIIISPASFDLVWSVECTEHLFDKPAFFQRAATWLKPSGTMAICAWLAGETSNSNQFQQVYDVCEGFSCPSLGTSAEYAYWMEQAGLEVTHCLDWTTRVSRTWEICRERVRRSRVRWVAKLIDRDAVLFLDRFDTILAAYESGAMKYGCFIARKKLEV